MKTLPSLLVALLLSSATASFAATTPAAGTPAPSPAKTAAPAKKDAAAKTDAPAKPEAPTKTEAPAAAPALSASALTDYFDALAQALSLTDPEKKAIEDRYKADVAEIYKIGNDSAISPLEKAQKIAALRDDRNVKINAILHDIDRKQTFHDIEVVHRVDITTLALDQDVAAACAAAVTTPAVPPAAATPAPATNAPAAEPAPAK